MSRLSVCPAAAVCSAVLIRETTFGDRERDDDVEDGLRLGDPIRVNSRVPLGRTESQTPEEKSCSQHMGNMTRNIYCVLIQP